MRALWIVALGNRSVRARSVHLCNNIKSSRRVSLHSLRMARAFRWFTHAHWHRARRVGAFDRIA